MTRILGLLPSRLHHLRTAWDNVSGAQKNVGTLIERLRLEEDRLNQNDEARECQNALVSTNDLKSSQGKTTVECFKCGKKGHGKKFC